MSEPTTDRTHALQRCRSLHSKKGVRCTLSMHHVGAHLNGATRWERASSHSRCTARHAKTRLQCELPLMHQGLCKRGRRTWHRRGTIRPHAGERNWEEVGRALRMSRERARQIGTAALAKLRCRHPDLTELLAALARVRNSRSPMLACEEQG